MTPAGDIKYAVVKRELMKLGRWSTVVVIALAVAAQVLFVLRYRAAATAEYGPWARDVHRLEELCRTEPAAPECASGGGLESAREQARLVAGDFPTVSAMSEPVGMVGFAAGHLASLIGILAIGAVGGYIGTDWSGRTLGLTLAHDPRRGLLLWRELTALAAAAVALLAISCVALTLLALSFGDRQPDVPPLPPGFDVGSWALSKLGSAVVVVAAFIGVTVFIAHVVKSAIATFAWVTGVVALAHAVALPNVVYRFSPAYWVAAWTDLDPAGNFGDHLWLSTFPLFGDASAGPGFAAWAGLPLLAVAAGAATLAALRFRTGDVK